MTNSAHSRAPGGDRIRLPLPPAFLELPMGLRPAGAFRLRARPELELVYPGEVGLRLDLVRHRVLEVRPGRAAPEAARRLGAAVQARWFKCAPVRDWLEQVASWTPARDVADVPGAGVFDADPAQIVWRSTRVGSTRSPGLPAGALVRAVALAVSGRGAVGQALLDGLGEEVMVDPRHALAAGLLAAGTERPTAAIGPLSRAVHLIDQGREALLGVATEVGDRKATLLALGERLEQAGPSPEERDRLVLELLAGDAASAALRLAQRWVERIGDDAATLQLAELELYRDRTDRARSLAASATAPSVRRERILAACDVLEGRRRAAIARLEPLDPDIDPQVILWLAQAQIELRVRDEPRHTLMRVRFAGQPAARLLKGLHDINQGRLRDDARQVYPRQAAALGVPPQGDDLASLERAGRLALTRLGGNRSATVTTVDEQGQLHRFRGLPPRVEYEHLQRRLLHAPVHDVLEAFWARKDADPGLPYPYTYGAELLLWIGEYERARDLLVEAWDRFETRWAYVGAGAAEALMGRHEVALDWWRRGDERFEMLDAESSWAYRGESWRRVGELDRAVADLEHALRFRPSRHGSRVDLARTHLQAGRAEDAGVQLRELSRVAPVLMAEARLDAGVGEGSLALDDLDLDARGEVLERAVHMLRGNRSSKLLTFIDRDGALRVFAEAHLERWTGVARRVSFLPGDAHLERLLSGEA